MLSTANKIWVYQICKSLHSVFIHILTNAQFLGGTEVVLCYKGKKRQKLVCDYQTIRAPTCPRSEDGDPIKSLFLSFQVYHPVPTAGSNMFSYRADGSVCICIQKLFQSFLYVIINFTDFKVEHKEIKLCHATQFSVWVQLLHVGVSCKTIKVILLNSLLLLLELLISQNQWFRLNETLRIED